MRRAILALVSVCALAACGQNAQQQQNADAGGGGLFPDLNTAAYRAEATLNNGEGDNIPAVMVRDGKNTRFEMNAPQGASTLISNGDTGETFVITNQGGRTIAIRASGMDTGVSNPMDSWQGELSENATRTGACSVAGENGAEWTRTTAEDGTDTVCVTEDGIILRATDDGRVAWEVTGVQRGPQDAAQFTLPEGVQVMDLGNLGALVEAARQRQH